jgi:hypothetical protein
VWVKLLAGSGVVLMALPVLVTGRDLVRIVVLLTDSRASTQPQVMESAASMALSLRGKTRFTGPVFILGLILALTGIAISPA